ncbi:Na+/H+ antiporter NhaC family protein [Alteromonas sp. ASW11-130]|uniref:Na+/H+ antiporter NhaC family protein n=1 Tax=Alteromonas sp. ASW11-130 TaxID=3015775 RepID=UPI0022427E59|nr:Na+/H+ antiporter NhaC family protein [Alteromonas sp. ASW11-130]MCW8092954.1 sodium:proton antiporter [Alteromonas sp. ASW11-130]
MSWVSVLPPLIAIAVVLWKKEVISALFVALMASELLLVIQDKTSLLLTFVYTIERVVEVAASPGNARILLFSLAIGAILSFIRDSGGVSATVSKLISSGTASTPRRAGGLTMFTGVAVFVESNLSVLTSGILARGLFDRFKMSRARLAFIIDSTSAPICILILLNGWGAFILGLLSNYDLAESGASILWGSTVFNFYAILVLLLVAMTVVTGKVFGPMKQSEKNLLSNDANVETGPKPTKARFMLIPLATLVFGMVGFMFWTGNGVLAEGSGSKSVLYATVLSIFTCFILSVLHRKYSTREFVGVAFKGIGELVPLVTIVLFSLCLGASLKELGTGEYVANMVGSHLPVFAIAPVLFLTGAIISFTTGTSWGTFAILIPIAVPLIHTTGLPPSFLVAAVLGGGVFGDHCSPISDTTAVSALASGCDLLEHVKTQLPYALTAGAGTLILYGLVGALM